MWRKTAIRATSKFAPLSIELQQAVGVDEQSETGRFDTAKVVDGDFMPTPQSAPQTDDEPQTRTAALRNKIAGGEPDQQDKPAPAPESQPADTAQRSDNAPTEAELFGQLDEVIQHPTKYNPETITELAALSDAISTARSDEFREKLGQAYEAMKTGGNTQSEQPQASGAQGAFFGG